MGFFEDKNDKKNCKGAKKEKKDRREVEFLKGLFDGGETSSLLTLLIILLFL